jgi:hypothetical protein
MLNCFEVRMERRSLKQGETRLKIGQQDPTADANLFMGPDYFRSERFSQRFTQKPSWWAPNEPYFGTNYRVNNS